MTSSGRTYSRLPFEGDLNDTRWFDIAFDFEPWERKNNGVVEREKEPAHAAVTSAIRASGRDGDSGGKW